ncbi:MAG TPA: polyphenol oxidase family protein [Solirubrobacteraceae bacterium]|nr:polyphenol oxidase family protein [Solirubrobacteraceae bacterium]
MTGAVPAAGDPPVPPPFRWRAEHLELELPGGGVLFTTRRGGVSEGPFASLNLGPQTGDDPARVDENRRRVQERVGARRLLGGHQVHGAHVAVERGEGEDADGQATARRGNAPIVLVADCLPIALVAPGAVAMVHAGWRGLAAGVVAAGVAAVRGLAPGAPVAAAIGPGARACCYEVGAEVHAAFGVARPRARTLDLPAIAAGQLAAAGVGQIHDAGLCTLCADPGLLFSHRRDRGVTGRQAGLAWRR